MSRRWFLALCMAPVLPFAAMERARLRAELSLTVAKFERDMARAAIEMRKISQEMSRVVDELHVFKSRGLFAALHGKEVRLSERQYRTIYG